MTDVSSAQKPQGRIARFLDSDIVFSFKRSPIAIVASIVALALILAAIFAPWIAPYNPFDPRTLNLMDGFTAAFQSVLPSFHPSDLLIGLVIGCVLLALASTRLKKTLA